MKTIIVATAGRWSDRGALLGAHQQKKKPRPEKQRQKNISMLIVHSTSHHLSLSLALIFGCFSCCAM